MIILYILSVMNTLGLLALLYFHYRLLGVAINAELKESEKVRETAYKQNGNSKNH